MREEASKILGFRIPENGWKKMLSEMWVSGKPNEKQMKELMFLLLERVEKLENERSNTNLQPA